MYGPSTLSARRTSSFDLSFVLSPIWRFRHARSHVRNFLGVAFETSRRREVLSFGHGDTPEQRRVRATGGQLDGFFPRQTGVRPCAPTAGEPMKLVKSIPQFGGLAAHVARGAGANRRVGPITELSRSTPLFPVWPYDGDGV